MTDQDSYTPKIDTGRLRAETADLRNEHTQFAVGQPFEWVMAQRDNLCAELDEARRRIKELTAAGARVLEMHPRWRNHGNGWPEACPTCSTPWPCQTAAALLDTAVDRAT